MLAEQVGGQDEHDFQHVVIVIWRGPEHMLPLFTRTTLPNTFRNAEFLCGRTLISWHYIWRLWVTGDNQIAWYEVPDKNQPVIIGVLLVRPPTHAVIQSIRSSPQASKKPLVFWPWNSFRNKLYSRSLVSFNLGYKYEERTTGGSHSPSAHYRGYFLSTTAAGRLIAAPPNRPDVTNLSYFTWLRDSIQTLCFSHSVLEATWKRFDKVRERLYSSSKINLNLSILLSKKEIKVLQNEGSVNDGMNKKVIIHVVICLVTAW